MVDLPVQSACQLGTAWLEMRQVQQFQSLSWLRLPRDESGQTAKDLATLRGVEPGRVAISFKMLGLASPHATAKDLALRQILGGGEEGWNLCPQPARKRLALTWASG